MRQSDNPIQRAEPLRAISGIESTIGVTITDLLLYRDNIDNIDNFISKNRNTIMSLLSSQNYRSSIVFAEANYNRNFLSRPCRSSSRARSVAKKKNRILSGRSRRLQLLADLSSQDFSM